MKQRTIADWGVRILLGGLSGWLLQLLICSSVASIGLMGPTSWHWDFSMLILGWNSAVPYATAEILASVLMFLVGALLGLSTLPFAEYGGQIRLETALHFVGMMVAVAALGWLLNGTLFFLIPALLMYLLIWFGRWVGWYAELGQMREKLGIVPQGKPSPLKWRETVPHIGYAFLLCAVVPLALRLFDPPDIPVLSTLLALALMLPVSLLVGVSLGLRRGFCPLYPLACGLFSFAVSPLLAMEFWFYLLFSFPPALLGVVIGSAVRELRSWWREGEPAG